MHARIQLPPEPRSASAARQWVRAQLSAIGRPDLVDAAEAGVSELVTNGILHAHTSIGLLLSRCAAGRVVIEVFDASPLSHRATLNTKTPSPDDATFGRGLRIVQANARDWGVSASEHGKAVWFEPAPAAGMQEIPGLRELPDAGADGGSDVDLDEVLAFLGDADLSAADLSAVDLSAVDLSAVDLSAVDRSGDDDTPQTADSVPETAGGTAESAGAEHTTQAEDLDDLVEVRLVATPTKIVYHYRERWLELIREMQLVALGAPSTQRDLARRFCQAVPSVTVDQYITEQSARSFVRALTRGQSRLDMLLKVPRSARTALTEIRAITPRVEREARAERMLYIAGGAQASQLWAWYLDECLRQLDGDPPRPWLGGTEVDDEALRSRINA